MNSGERKTLQTQCQKRKLHVAEKIFVLIHAYTFLYLEISNTKKINEETGWKKVALPAQVAPFDNSFLSANFFPT